MRYIRACWIVDLTQRPFVNEDMMWRLSFKRLEAAQIQSGEIIFGGAMFPRVMDRDRCYTVCS